MRPFIPSLIALAIFSLSGCDKGSQNTQTGTTTPGTDVVEGSDPSAPAEDSKGTIGYSAMTLTNPFFKVIANNMTDEAKKHGYEVNVLSADNDPVKQSNQIDNFIVQEVAAIVLNPTDTQALGPAIVRANEAGIPVFTNDLAHAGDKGEVVCNIATDNLQGGRLAGEAMVKAIGEQGGKVAILDFPQAESCQQRVAGFTEVIEAHNAKADANKIDVVMKLDGGGAIQQGADASKAIIEATPDLAAIFAINDPSALGAYSSLEAAGKEKQVALIGFDGQDIGKKAIRDGKILCDPIQFPDQIGVKTIEQIIAHFAGEDVPEEILIPSSLYYQEDAIKEFGAPENSDPPESEQDSAEAATE